MQTASTFARITMLAVGIAGVLAATDANAAAFQLAEKSAKGLGRAFAGSGSAEGDASIIAANPAGMRQLDGRVIQGDLSAISFKAEFEGAGRKPTGAPQTGGDGGDAGMIAPVRRTRGDDIDAACGQLKGQVMDRTRRQAEFRKHLQAQGVDDAA